MPTVGWIQETGQDRLWERGSDPGENPLPMSYPCRHCNLVFDSISAREQHELEHPLQNPMLFFRDKEQGMSTLLITTPTQPSDWGARNIAKLNLNGRNLASIVELQQILEQKKRGLYTLHYANDALEKQLKIEVCIAEESHITDVDHAFRLYFSTGSISDQQILGFQEAVKHCDTVERYINGLVRYIHGLRSKDQQSELTTFEDFDKRFNQSLDGLKNYQTALSEAIRAVIRFNRNDFFLMHNLSGLPSLDQAASVFHGGEHIESSKYSVDTQLPVDYATEYILEILMPAFNTALFDEFSELARNLPMRFRSPQDNSKINYLCWRVATKYKNQEMQSKYRQKLRYDDVFNRLTGDTNQ